MKQKIDKILKLNFLESFLQINYEKGYKYVDNAGEIVNHFYVDNKEPLFEMTLQGLTIRNPRERADELRITPKSFWTHFVNPGSFEEVENFHIKESNSVMDILNIKYVTRIGWRNYFVYDFEDDDEMNNVMSKFVPLQEADSKFKELNFEYKCNDILSNIILKSVFKIEDEKNPGILIDIDFYKNYEDESLATDNIPAELEKIKDTIKSEDLLVFINKILK